MDKVQQAMNEQAAANQAVLAAEDQLAAAKAALEAARNRQSEARAALEQAVAEGVAALGQASA